MPFLLPSTRKGQLLLLSITFTANIPLLSAANIVPAEEVIIDATFNNIADGILEDFDLISNPIGNPMWDNATGQASMSTDANSNGTVGCVSNNSFEGSTFSALTASFEISEIIDLDGEPTSNGHWVGLQGNNSELWNNSERAGETDGWSLGIRFLSGDLNFVYDNPSGNEITISSLGSFTIASLQDGYTVDFHFDFEGWEACLTGINGSSNAQDS